MFNERNFMSLTTLYAHQCETLWDGRLPPSRKLADDPVYIGRHLGIDPGELWVAAAEASRHDTHQLVGAIVQPGHQRTARVAATRVLRLAVPTLGTHLGALETARESRLEPGRPATVGGLALDRVADAQCRLLQDVGGLSEELEQTPAGHLHILTVVLGAGRRQADGRHVLRQVHRRRQPHHGQVVLGADVLRVSHDLGDVPLLVVHIGGDPQVVVADSDADGGRLPGTQTVSGRQQVPVRDEDPAAEPPTQDAVRPPSEQCHPRPLPQLSIHSVEDLDCRKTRILFTGTQLSLSAKSANSPRLN